MIDLLVPQYLLQSERFKEFLEALSECLQEIRKDVSDLGELWNLWDREPETYDYFEKVLEMLGMHWAETYIGSYYQGTTLDFIHKKGTWIFFKTLLHLLENPGVVPTDLSQYCLKWSTGRRWSCNLFEDARSYRDRCLYLDVTGSWMFRAKVLEHVPIGTFMWITVYSGVNMFCYSYIPRLTDVVNGTIRFRGRTQNKITYVQPLLAKETSKFNQRFTNVSPVLSRKLTEEGAILTYQQPLLSRFIEHVQNKITYVQPLLAKETSNFNQKFTSVSPVLSRKLTEEGAILTHQQPLLSRFVESAQNKKGSEHFLTFTKRSSFLTVDQFSVYRLNLVENRLILS